MENPIVLFKRPGGNGAPANPNGETCAKCRYFVVIGQASMDLSAPQGGLCRRYPPTAQILGLAPNPNPKMPPIPQVSRAMPQVFSPEWCGEFSAGE